MSIVWQTFYRMNKKRTYNLYRQFRLQIRTKRKKFCRSYCIALLPIAMDERGAMDFIHEQFRNGRRFRILNRVDDYSRICIGQIIALSISGLCIANYLSQLIQFRQVKPKSIVCDNRAEFTSKAMFYMFYWSRAQLDCIPSGKRTQNAYIGSCYGKSQDSCLNQYWLYPLTNAKTTIENWFIDYNRVRLHRSLGYQPLSVFVQKLASKIVQKRKEVKINNNVI